MNNDEPIKDRQAGKLRPQLYRMKLKKHQICLLGLFWLLIVSVFPTTIYGQRFSAGIVGGLNASQIDGDLLAGFDKVGLTGGLKAVVNFDSPFNLNIEFLYSQRGSRPDIFNPQYDPDIQINLHYAEIPVYVSLGDWWQEEEEYYKVSAHAGVSYGRLINASAMDGFNGPENSLEQLVPFFNDNDISWLVGATFRINEKLGIMARYTREITPLLSPKKHDLQIERLISYYVTFRAEYYF